MLPIAFEAVWASAESTIYMRQRVRAGKRTLQAVVFNMWRFETRVNGRSTLC